MIYLDSCLVIYAVEPNGTASDSVLAAITGSTEAFAVSPLVLMECLVGPLRRGQASLVEAYESLIVSIEMIPLTTEVLRRAAALRASAALKTPDAIHLAAAMIGGCSALWTNDRRLAGVAGDFAVAVVGR